MPIYEYACSVCGNKFDKLRPVSRMDDDAPCPICEGDSERKLSVFAAFVSDDFGAVSSVAGGGCGGCGPSGCACAAGA